MSAAATLCTSATESTTTPTRRDATRADVDDDGRRVGVVGGVQVAIQDAQVDDGQDAATQVDDPLDMRRRAGDAGGRDMAPDLPDAEDRHRVALAPRKNVRYSPAGAVAAPGRTISDEAGAAIRTGASTVAFRTFPFYVT